MSQKKTEENPWKTAIDVLGIAAVAGGTAYLMYTKMEERNKNALEASPCTSLKAYDPKKRDASEESTWEDTFKTLASVAAVGVKMFEMYNESSETKEIANSLFNVDEPEKCALCLKTVSSQAGRRRGRLDCGHIIHHGCFYKSLSENRECFHCRQ